MDKEGENRVEEKERETGKWGRHEVEETGDKS